MASRARATFTFTYTNNTSTTSAVVTARATARFDAMTKLAELLEACDHGDSTRLERLGWREVIEALRMWPRRLGFDDLKSYVIALADEAPDLIVTAIRGLAGSEYRPSPSAVYIALHTRPGGPGAELRAIDGRPDITPIALRAVLMAVAGGEDICDCHPRPPMWVMDRDGVLRCMDCGGIEVGQYETAMQSPETAE